MGNDTCSTAVISNKDGVTAEKPLYFFLERYMQAYVKEVSEFIDCVQKDKPVPVGIEDGLQAVRIGVSAKKSLAEGREVKLSEIEGCKIMTGVRVRKFGRGFFLAKNLRAC